MEHTLSTLTLVSKIVHELDLIVLGAVPHVLWACVLVIYCANVSTHFFFFITNSPKTSVFLSSAISVLMATVEGAKIILIIEIIIAVICLPSATF